MAFSVTKLGDSVFGNKRIQWGTFDGSGVETGELETNLNKIDYIGLVITTSTAPTTASSTSVNETYPITATSAATIFIPYDSDGTWFVIGN